MLASRLRASGIETSLHDLNLEAFDALLTGAGLETYLQELEHSVDHALQVGTLPLQEARLLLLDATDAVSSVSQAKEILRSLDRFGDSADLHRALATLQRAFSLLNTVAANDRMQIGPFRIDFASMRDGLSLSDCPTPLDEHLHRLLLEHLNLEQPHVLGFSVHSKTQLVFALRLTEWVRAQGFGLHVAIGGTFLGRYAKRVAEFAGLLPAVDSVVLFSGEETLVHLCQEVAAGRSPSARNNLVSLRRDGTATWGSISPSRSRHEAPNVDVDFDGLPLARYFAPLPIFSIPVTIGCHWRRCSFCSYNLQPYTEHNPSRMVDTLRRLKERYGVGLFYFSVSELKASFLKAMVEKMLESDLAIYWTSLIRADVPISREFAADLYASGCRLLAIGIESGSTEMLCKMRKGIVPDTAREMLATLHQAGIAVIAYFMVGHPHECMSDLRETLAFIESCKPHLFGYTLTQFVLSTNAPLYVAPNKYGIALGLDCKQLNLTELIEIDQRIPWHELNESGEAGGVSTSQSIDRHTELIHDFLAHEHNFFDNEGQYFPLRAPPDTFWSFLTLALGGLGAGPGAFAAEGDLLATVPFLDYETTVLESIEANGTTLTPVERRRFRNEDHTVLCLTAKEGGWRYRLDELSCRVLRHADGRRTVGEITRSLQPDLRVPAMTKFAELYHRNLIDLRVTGEGG